MTTRCLGDFASALSRLPKDGSAWRDLVQAQPVVCPHTDCRPGGCRALCRAYAVVQWKVSRAAITPTAT